MGKNWKNQKPPISKTDFGFGFGFRSVFDDVDIFRTIGAVLPVLCAESVFKCSNHYSTEHRRTDAHTVWEFISLSDSVFLALSFVSLFWVEKKIEVEVFRKFRNFKCRLALRCLKLNSLHHYPLSIKCFDNNVDKAVFRSLKRLLFMSSLCEKLSLSKSANVGIKSEINSGRRCFMNMKIRRTLTMQCPPTLDSLLKEMGEGRLWKLGHCL